MDGVKHIQTVAKSLIIGLLTLSLSACVSMAPQQEQPEPVQPEPEEEVETIPVPPDALTPSQRVRKALQQLEHGKYEDARLQLTWALQEKPTLQIALNLLEQMDVDPIDHLGMKSFFYNVEPGDSLSIIAKKFLNDPLKFVVLARYNKLENPSKLAPGQRIRVPGVMPERKRPKRKPKPKPKPKPIQPEPAPVAKEPSEPAPVAEEPAKPTPSAPIAAEQATIQAETATNETQIEEQTLPTPEASVDESVEIEQPPKTPTEPTVEKQPIVLNVEEALSSARGLHSEGNISAAIYLLENEISQHPSAEELPKLLAGYYNEHADQLIDQGNLNNARTTLEKLIILDSSDDEAINKLIMVEDKIEAQKLLTTAQDLQTEGDLEKAYQTYTQVLTYDPENPLAKESQLAVRDQLTDGYHRSAMQLFRKQELDQAIVFWNKILELNPNHPLAPGYKARALEMKQQLQKIDQ
ncbi:MAG: LysM peptidoglycan-binding domain-containing protein [Candidatus Thiodiazotropha sp.]